MEIFTYRSQLDAFLKTSTNAGHQIGFVPTMGALHQGHENLILASLEKKLTTICSIFVNPKQFNNNEDLIKYPRNNEKDISTLQNLGCHVLFLPAIEEVYASDFKDIYLNLAPIDSVFEGEKRPGHFEGVVQVLFQLFDLIKPKEVFFGQKDYQQCLIVKRLINANFSHIALNIIETARNEEGLALSSRNQRLSKNGLEIASYLNKGLNLGLTLCERFVPAQAVSFATMYLINNGLEIEYLDIANADTLESYENWESIPAQKIIIAAAYIENVRLIDNLIF